MIVAREIRKSAADAVRQYGTRDPFTLAREMHIELLVRELGTLKGFYKDVYGTPFIFLSRHLSRGEATLVCAHELGHHLLHRQFAALALRRCRCFRPRPGANMRPTCLRRSCCSTRKRCSTRRGRAARRRRLRRSSARMCGCGAEACGNGSFGKIIVKIAFFSSPRRENVVR